MTTNQTTNQKVLIVGAGVAGLASAIELKNLGWDVTVIERAPERRRGGYFIALMPTGVAPARRMGILDKMPNRQPKNAQTFTVTRNGKTTPGAGYAGASGTGGFEFRSLLRGDVENALYTSLPEGINILFGTTVTSIHQENQKAYATLRSTLKDASAKEHTEEYDLILGADGVNSSIRKMVFGPDANYIDELGYMVAASLATKPLATADSTNSYAFAEPGRAVWTFPFEGENPSIMFTYRTDDIAGERAKGATAALRSEFLEGKEESAFLSELIDDFEAADDKLFDSAKQVQMKQWYNGRVALIGDAAWCLTLYSGLGVSTGIAGANLLGNLLHENPSLDEVLPIWNARMLEYVAVQQQDVLEGGRSFFVPADTKEYLMSQLLKGAISIPPVKKALTATRLQKMAQKKSVDVADPSTPLPH